MPPVGEDEPPPALPLGEEEPPDEPESGDCMPPVEPPLGDEAPPLGEEEPPLGEDAPPLGDDCPPEEPLLGVDGAPLGDGIPPLGLDMPPDCCVEDSSLQAAVMARATPARSNGLVQVGKNVIIGLDFMVWCLRAIPRCLSRPRHSHTRLCLE